MNSNEISTLALGLTEPWIISNVEIQTDADSIKDLHIHLDFKTGHKFEDETVADVSCARHTSKNTASSEFFCPF